MSNEATDKRALLEAELEHLHQQRLSAPRHGPGQSLAIVVVDFQKFFTQQGNDPTIPGILESTATMLERAREKGVPVFLAAMTMDGPDDVVVSFAARHDLSKLFRGSSWRDQDPALKQAPTDVIVEKRHASCFCGTTLDGQLRRLGVDTVLLAGTSTSGCVRSTAIEGAGLNYRMELVEECAHEPRPLSGPVALSELQDRYCDVISLEEALEQIETIGYKGQD